MMSHSSDHRRLPHFKCAINADEILAGTVAAVEIDGRQFVVCNDDGTFYATAPLCPHAEGSLSGGKVCDGCLVCPVHHWPWDLKTGLTAREMPHLWLKRYACEVRDGFVYVDVSAPLPPVLDADLFETD